jgi:alpha-mannosidase
MTVENLNETRNVVVGEINLGPIRKVIRYSFSFGQRSRLGVTVSLNDGSSMLDFDISVDFHEVCGGENIPQLNFIAPVGYAVANYRYDVPFGTLDRPEIEHDVPANSYAAAVSADGEEKPSLMVVTDTKYGFRGANNAIAVTLIRASRDPDPYPEYGKHSIRIGVGIVDGVANATLDQAAVQYVHPLALCSARAGKGTLPMNGQFLKVQGDVRISAVKTAEDVDGVIVRLSDISGKGGAFKLTFAGAVASAQETDLNENVLGDLTVAGNDVCAEVEAYGVKTVLVRF